MYTDSLFDASSCICIVSQVTSVDSFIISLCILLEILWRICGALWEPGFESAMEYCLMFLYYVICFNYKFGLTLIFGGNSIPQVNWHLSMWEACPQMLQLLIWRRSLKSMVESNLMVYSLGIKGCVSIMWFCDVDF